MKKVNKKRFLESKRFWLWRLTPPELEKQIMCHADSMFNLLAKSSDHLLHLSYLPFSTDLSAGRLKMQFAGRSNLPQTRRILQNLPWQIICFLTLSSRILLSTIVRKLKRAFASYEILTSRGGIWLPFTPTPSPFTWLRAWLRSVKKLFNIGFWRQKRSRTSPASHLFSYVSTFVPKHSAVF